MSKMSELDIDRQEAEAKLQSQDIVQKVVQFNSQPLAYTNKTMFLVQVAHDGGAYKTRYSFEGDIHQALFYFKGINVGNGYKKRLYAPSLVPSLLARVIT